MNDQLSKTDFETIRPEPDSVLQSLRAFGYSIETAIADIIDNSITAGATKILISFGINHTSSFVRIEDNGKGMSEYELVNAMKIGSFNPINKRDTDDLGRFGLGLKTASFSQCKRLTVKTKNKHHESECVRVWDLDLVQKNKDWVLCKRCIDKYSEENLSNLTSQNSGTIVLWENLDRLVEYENETLDKAHFYRKFERVKLHLGLVFHRFLEKDQLEIKVHSDKILPVNPFEISDTYSSLQLQEESLFVQNELVKVQPFILPHDSKLTFDEIKDLDLVKGWVEQQGIYLYRNKRLIIFGSWLDLPIKKKESQRLARIQIDIPNTIDKEWQIDVKKASAKIPDVIRKRVRKICEETIAKAIKVYTHRGAYIRQVGASKEIVYIWQTKQKKGKKIYCINEAHPFYEFICEQLGKNQKLFKNYIKLIAEMLPVNMIAVDFGDPQTILGTELENDKERISHIYQSAVKVLSENGLTVEQAMEKLKNIDMFKNI
jgi:hypothetical protein